MGIFLGLLLGFAGRYGFVFKFFFVVVVGEVSRGR